jgi:hypothetical protein
MEALAKRLRQPPLGDMEVAGVKVRFSQLALRDLLDDCHAGFYAVWPVGKNIFLCQFYNGDNAFEFSVDDRLPGKSFVLSVKK